MKNLKPFAAVAIAAFAASLTPSAFAQATLDPGKMDGMKTAQAAPALDMTDGEIRKVDKDTKKITIKHGEIKSLDMPGMTMLFLVKDPAMLDMVKPGDKVKFRAEKAGGSIMVTEIQVAK